MNNLINAINKIDDRKMLWVTTGMLAVNTGCLIDAMVQIHKMDKAMKRYRKNHQYMTKLAEGLEEIAINPKADPIENREAVQTLLDNVNAEMLLEGVDFESIMKEHKTDD